MGKGLETEFLDEIADFLDVPSWVWVGFPKAGIGVENGAELRPTDVVSTRVVVCPLKSYLCAL